MQGMLAGLIVLGSAGYAAWALMPAAWRQVLARHWVTWPVLARWAAIRSAAVAAPGPACHGCEGRCGKPPAGPAGAQPVRFVSRHRPASQGNQALKS